MKKISEQNRIKYEAEEAERKKELEEENNRLRAEAEEREKKL